mgnify:CR=1 FL=1
MLQSGKQVFMYFSDKPIPPSKINGDGYEKIQAFRDKYKDKEYISLIHPTKNLKRCFLPIFPCIFLDMKRG